MSAAPTPAAPEVIARARELNPDVHIFVRGTYLRDVPLLRTAGAEQVFSGEGEVALAMTEAVLRRLGATPDQIDRERARVREELIIPEASGSPPGSSGSAGPGTASRPRGSGGSDGLDAVVQAALQNR